MMYGRVGDALRQAGLNSHPTDWLLFLCPGKREAAGPWLDQLEPATEPVAATMRRTLRGPIYVHSKMMIVDDAYIIVGSANINQVCIAAMNDVSLSTSTMHMHTVSANDLFVMDTLHVYKGPTGEEFERFVRALPSSLSGPAPVEKTTFTFLCFLHTDH